MAAERRRAKLFVIDKQGVKKKLRERVINNLEKGKKRVPLQPANEETRSAGQFIKRLEKGEERGKKRLKIFCEREKKFAPLQPLRKGAEVLRKV